MLLPALDPRGLLPPGQHRAVLEQVPLVFCTNAYRWELWDAALSGLSRVCEQARCYPPPYPDLVLGGSFFSDKSFPADIEATLVYPPDTLPTTCWEWATQFVRIHAILKEQHRLDFYPSLPGQSDFSIFFQYVGPKTASAKGLAEKDPRGVVQVLDW